MNLDLINNLFNNLKENKLVQNFTKELSNYLEKNSSNNSFTNNWVDLSLDDLTLFNTKITTKYRDEILIERNNILKNYANCITENKDMFYIYNISSNKNNCYNLYNCKTNEILTESLDNLPTGSELGSILIKSSDGLSLDLEATHVVSSQINSMIMEKIEEQKQYLSHHRIDGHVYEVSEKSSGRIWLYDLNSIDGTSDGIEEVAFPQDLYESTKEGDLFVFMDGSYQYLNS